MEADVQKSIRNQAAAASVHRSMPLAISAAPSYAHFQGNNERADAKGHGVEKYTSAAPLIYREQC